MITDEILPYLDGLEQEVIDHVINNIKKRNDEFEKQRLAEEQFIKDWYKEQMDNNQCFLVNFNDDSFCLIKTFDNKITDGRWHNQGHKNDSIVKGESWTVNFTRFEHCNYVCNPLWLNNPYEHYYGEKLPPPYISTEIYDNLVTGIKNVQRQTEMIINKCRDYCSTLNIKQQ